jgi:hypothetical protein
LFWRQSNVLKADDPKEQIKKSVTCGPPVALYLNRRLPSQVIHDLNTINYCAHLQSTTIDQKSRVSIVSHSGFSAHEHDPNPEMRPSINIDVERLEKLILGIAASVAAVYRYFAPQRRRIEAGFAAERTAERKIGRNDL